MTQALYAHMNNKRKKKKTGWQIAMFVIVRSSVSRKRLLSLVLR
jgi:hypothetical protein